MSTLDFLATPPAPSRPYHVLRHRDFRLLWGSQFVSLTGSQMQVVALNWHIYVLTGSPLALGLVGLTRVVPVIVFSLWGGLVAARPADLPRPGQPGRALRAERRHGGGLRVRQPGAAVARPAPRPPEG